MGWAHSMMNWYENREVQLQLPESLKIEIETEVDEQKETPTMGY